MFVKNSLTRVYYSLILTSPKLSSPIVIQTFTKYPSEKEIQQIGQPHVEKNRDWSLLVHFDEQPQLHVVPIYIPYSSEESQHKLPLLHTSNKLPYLA